MSQKNLKHIEQIKENINKSNTLSQQEKSDSFKRIEEWYAEDKAFGMLTAELSKISPTIEAYLAELGLI